MVVLIHVGIGREERLKGQESFKHDSKVQVLLATDAAGEGINLQRAHLMINYGLPRNPKMAVLLLSAPVILAGRAVCWRS